MRRILGVSLLGVAGLLAAACSGGGSGASSGSSSATTSTVKATTTTVAVGAIPGTPAGSQLQWVLDHGATATDTEISAHVTTAFAAAVPPDKFRSVQAQLGRLRVKAVRSSTATHLVAAVTPTAGAGLVVTIDVEAAASHRIASLLFTTDVAAAPSTWTAVDQRLARLAPRASVFAAELAADGTLTPVHSLDPEVSRPLGSAFKLYVLGALIKAVKSGRIQWDDELTITDAIKSLPTGQLQDRPAGTKVTVEEAATLMISISDNTAADLLADRLGRPAIEATLEPMGMGADSQRRTEPFLTTGELFRLKWGPPGPLSGYAAATVSGRERILRALPSALPAVSAVNPDQPVGIDDAEWFASPAELARAQAWIDGQRDQPGLEPLAAILQTNPGVPFDHATWPTFAFKGGSEPGVVTLSWLLRRKDGHRFVLVIEASSTTGPVSADDAASIAVGAITLLAKAPG